MVNLLKFKEKAKYKDGRETNLSGEEAYKVYMNGVDKIIRETLGGALIFYGNVRALMIGEVSRLWDVVVVVKYPSISAFLALAKLVEDAGLSIHREAGLEGQLLIETILPSKL